MNPDRKSTVSSFYGDKSSFDALNNDFQPGHYARPSAGYNQESFLAAGRQEPLKGGRDEEADLGSPHDQGWDVFADFNNAGPKYSTAFGQNDAGYAKITLPYIHSLVTLFFS